MKLVTNKLKSGGVHSGNLESWEPSQHLLLDTGKPRKTCVRGDQSQDLPNTDFYLAVQHCKVKNSSTHIVQQIHIWKICCLIYHHIAAEKYVRIIFAFILRYRL